MAKRKNEEPAVVEEEVDDDPVDEETSEEEESVSIFTYIKIGVLLITWLTIVIILSQNKPYIPNENLIPVYPERVSFFELRVDNTNLNAVILKIYAPFQEDDDSPLRDFNASTYLLIQISLVRSDDQSNELVHSEFLSDHWKPSITIDANYTSLERSFNFFENIKSGNSNNRLAVELSTSTKSGVPIGLAYREYPYDKNTGIVLGTIVLIFLYVMIIFEFINRTFAAMIASTMALSILTALQERPDTRTIMSWVDVETMLLLIGMMLLIAVLSESGIFDYFAVFAFQITKGDVWPLINVLCLSAVFLSAFLDNVTMMLLATPVVIRLCEMNSLYPVPILSCMVVFSNVGAACTPVGDPPNVIISTNEYVVANNVNFLNFVIHMLPGVIAGVGLCWITVRIRFIRKSDLQYLEQTEVEDLKHEIAVWEKQAASADTAEDQQFLQSSIKRRVKVLKSKLTNNSNNIVKDSTSFHEKLANLKKQFPIRNKRLLVKSMVAFVFVIAAFLSHAMPSYVHLTLGWAAFIGALMLLIMADSQDIEAVLGRVEWTTLVFFAALLVLMEALTKLSVIDTIGNKVIEIIQNVERENRLTVALLIIIWVSAFASMLLNNVPVSTMMVKIVVTLSKKHELGLPLHPLVWALAFGTCYGGNGTLVGASANVVSAGVAEQHGYKFTFMGFLSVGFPVMVSTTLGATGYLLLAHVVWEWH